MTTITQLALIQRGVAHDTIRFTYAKGEGRKTDPMHAKYIFDMAQHLSEDKLIRLLRCSWTMENEPDFSVMMVHAARARTKHGDHLSDHFLLSLVEHARKSKRMFSFMYCEAIAKENQWILLLHIADEESLISTALVLAVRAKRMDVVEILASRLPPLVEGEPDK